MLLNAIKVNVYMDEWMYVYMVNQVRVISELTVYYYIMKCTYLNSCFTLHRTRCPLTNKFLLYQIDLEKRSNKYTEKDRE